MNKNTQVKGSQSEQIINQKIDQRVISTREKTTISLQAGKNTTTFQGGVEVPIMFKEVLAGEYIKEWNITNITRFLSPLVPTLDKLFLTVKAFFVPHTRVWADAEKSLAGKESLDNVSNDNLNVLPVAFLDESGNANFSNEYLFNYSLLQKYGFTNHGTDSYSFNLLLLRGYRAIENDFLISKEYQLPKVEWNETVPTSTEFENLVLKYESSGAPKNYDNFYGLAAAKARDGYLTNIKKNMGSTGTSNVTNITEHLDWQNRYNDEKQRIDNAEKNDWDIIAEMGGTQPVLADRVQLLGKLDYELNYQQITQTSAVPNEATPLGTTGSFSYTRGEGTLFSHKKFDQAGFIHILVNVNLEQISESGIPKELLKTYVDEIFRPGLSEKEIQLLYGAEIDGYNGAKDAAAYQPPFAEYKRLPSFASGQMLSRTLNDLEYDDGVDQFSLSSVSNAHWHNMLNLPVTISKSYLNPAKAVNYTLARNNVLQTLIVPPTPLSPGLEHLVPALEHLHVYFEVDPFINISEHRVKTSLPITQSTISQTEKATESR